MQQQFYKKSVDACTLTLPVRGYLTRPCVEIVMILWVHFRTEKSPSSQPCRFFDVTCPEHFIQPELTLCAGDDLVEHTAGEIINAHTFVHLVTMA